MMLLQRVLLAALSATPVVASPSSESANAARTSQPIVHAEVNRESRLLEAQKQTRLGMGHLKKKEYGLARPRLERALTIYRAVLGEDNLVTAWHLNVLGCLCVWTDNGPAAERHFQQALMVFRTSLGKNHPAYVETLSNLAGLYLKTGRLDRARPLLVQVCAYYKMRHGEEHPTVAASLTNLGLLALRSGQHEQAEAYFRQGLMIYRKCHGETHPTYAHTLDLLGQLSTAKGDHATAEAFFQQALAIDAIVLPPGDPQLVECVERYAALLRLMGRAKDATEMETKARTIRQGWVGIGKDMPATPPSSN